MSKNIIALTVFFFSAILISLLITQRFIKHLSGTPLSPSNVILAFANEVSYQSYDKKGRLQSTIQVASLKNYQKDREFIFQQPHGLVYTKNRIPWQIRANKGSSRHSTQWIFLKGNVIMHQLPYPHRPETVIKTESVKINPNKSFAYTDDAVFIQQLGNSVQGIGMKANLNTGVIDILSQPRGYYFPN